MPEGIEFLSKTDHQGGIGDDGTLFVQRLDFILFQLIVSSFFYCAGEKRSQTAEQVSTCYELVKKLCQHQPGRLRVVWTVRFVQRLIRCQHLWNEIH